MQQAIIGFHLDEENQLGRRFGLRSRAACAA